MTAITGRRIGVGLLLASAMLLTAADAPDSAPDSGQDAAHEQLAGAPAGDSRGAFLIRVPLPLRGAADERVKRQLELAVGGLEGGESRPLVVLEFAHEDAQQTGMGSEYERALSLARRLASRDLSRVRTIAFVPQKLEGHAVLAALACEELIMASDAEIGAAGAGEESIDAAMRAAYLDIATRTRILPSPLVLSMLDPSREVFKVATLDGAKYVDREGLEQLQREAAVGDVSTLVRAGEYGRFRGEDLRRDFASVSRLASNRQELATALRLPSERFAQPLETPDQWRAIRIDLRGPLNSNAITRAIQAIENQVRGNGANLLCLVIESGGGSPAASVELANYLASFDSSELRTIAFVNKKAQGDAILPALACDEFYVTQQAILGGPGESFLSERARFDLKSPLQNIAKRKSQHWSLMLGLVDTQTTVYRFTREGGGAAKFLCDEEWGSLESNEQWIRGEALDLTRGATASQAIEWKIANRIVLGLSDVANQYHVEQFERAERSKVISTIENFASNRWLARTFLFIAFVALMSEASAPGLGVPGFISAVCFMLFFWIQFLNGTADWLEVVLFVGGLLFLGIEAFVVPGFGIFGVGGLIMFFGAIYLATQTFILPRNSYQYDQIAGSMLTMSIGFLGIVAGVLALRYVFPRTPLAKHLLLLPPEGEELAERHQREFLADYSFLAGKAGVAHTPLRPAGKAMIGDEVIDVISRGEIVDRGAPVRVVEVQGHRVVVEPLENAAFNQTAES